MAGLRVVVVGAGVMGATAALELARRGHGVTLVDPGPLPHPLAASTDVSKVVRIEYGSSEDYMKLGERALAGWHVWNRELGTELYHETGVLHLSLEPMAKGSFEQESWDLLRKRGHSPERIGAASLAKRFPAFEGAPFTDGFFHARGGWVESGKVVSRVVELARKTGVELREGAAFERLALSGARVTGVHLRDGTRLDGDRVLVAAGAWTPHVLPSLAASFRSTGMPVFHLRPRSPERFRAPAFPVFTGDISKTGYYGFPLHPEAGVVKVARHGVGRIMHPESKERVVTEDEIAHLRAFLEQHIPSLAGAEIVYTRVCLYCDSLDGDLWIAPSPEHEGLVVAAGDSGHAFKFAPVLGELAADAVLGKRNELTDKFRWRPAVHEAGRGDAARYLGHERPALLTVDVFGTILDWRTGLENALRSAGVTLGPGDFDRVIDEQAKLEHASFRLYREIVEESLVRALGVERSVARKVGEDAGTWPLYPDSREALRSLLEIAPCVAMTNSDRSHGERIQAQLGFELSDWVTAEEVRLYKPRADFWHAVSRKRGKALGRDWFHVSAYADYDLETARSLGLTCVFVGRPHARPGKADISVPDLASLVSALRQRQGRIDDR